MGKEELEQMGPEEIEVVRAESGHQGADWEYYFSKLDRKFTATAYLFRCRHCGQLGGYSDKSGPTGSSRRLCYDPGRKTHDKMIPATIKALLRPGESGQESSA